MYLKSLELYGFKSFPNKTVLRFEPGATVVIGPNGSGKSNISDAMRWVLGEISSKNIRGTKMEDVIFGGADARRPMSFAEVSVTFDNSVGAHRMDLPYDEITVTRRYYRSGESEYFINRKAVRLRDVHELFMNTGIGRDGYSVIGQGKISEILSRKSEERRNVFEEAAGIAKYRYKKYEAEKKLSATDENLVRLNDIAAELESRVGPLERDSRKAKKYLEIYDAKRRADVRLWIFDSAALKEKVAAAQKAVHLSEHELEVAEDSLHMLETQSDKLFEESQRGKMASEKLLTEIGTLKEQIHQADSAYKVTENEIAHRRELMEKSAESVSAARAQIDEAEGEETRLACQAEEVKAKIELAAKERAGLEERRAACAQRADALEKEIDEKHIEAQKLRDASVEMKVRIGALESTVSADDSASAKASDEIAERQKDAQALQTEIDGIRAEIAAYKENADQTALVIETLAKDVDAAEADREKRKASAAEEKLRLDGYLHRAESLERMEELFEGYSGSVRFVMQAASDGKIGGGQVYGPLSKLISVPEQYVTAVETAFGANIQNIAVENEAVAVSAIRALKEARAGRATFYPLTSVTAQDETEEMIRARAYAGYIGRADLLFDYDPLFAEIMRSILGRTLVFDTLDNASKMAREQKYRVKVVTLDGQVIHAGGSYTGGSVRRDSGILTRSAEIKSLRKMAKEAEERLFAEERMLSAAEKTLHDAQSRREGALAQREIIQALIAAERARLEAQSAKLAANEELCEKLRADIERLRSQKDGFGDELLSLQKAADEAEARIEEIRIFRANKDSERNSALDEVREMEARLGENSVLLAELKKDAQTLEDARLALKARVCELTETTAAALQSVEKYRADIENFAQAQTLNRESVAQDMTRLSLLTEQRGSVESGTAEYERKLNETRLKIREKTGQKETILLAHTKNESKLHSLLSEQDKLAERMLEEYELTYGAALELGYPPLEAAERPALAASAAEYRREMKSLGSVNVGAIEEYTQVKTRYDELASQIEDLQKSKTELVTVIHRLENEMRGQFMDAFNRINDHFSKVFAELFGGGCAELILTEPEDVLGSGIEIKAAPPGKIIKSLTLLSGGEQAFVAIALFFAILKVNPSPFCILDEIEAALDEVNVSRFAEYVKRMSDNTQFVLITHRRGTMEAADRIYGVTMPERGVSKVLALNVDEVKFD